MAALHELTGRDLVCWCAPLRCHCETLLRLANPEAPAETTKSPVLKLLSITNAIAYVEADSMEALDIAVGEVLDFGDAGRFRVLAPPIRSMLLMQPMLPTNKWLIKVDRQ